MSSLSRVTIVKLGKIEKHPNADNLQITEIYGCPVIMKSGQYNEGDLATFIPVDMICPNLPEYEFLGNSKRVKAKKLRGIFSMGLLSPAPENSKENDDVTDLLKFAKYEPPIKGEKNVHLGPVDEVSAPSGEIKYTDIESLRRYKDQLEIGEKVVITEKLHGGNARYIHSYFDNNFYAGSHRRWLDMLNDNIWTKAARDLDLITKLKEIPNYIVFGEIYGNVQDLRYGHEKGRSSFAAFDIFNINEGRYLDYDEFEDICIDLKIPIVPVLYRGLWKGFDAHKDIAEGNSTLAENVREGFVVRPVLERWSRQVGRVILKLHGEGYLLRK